MTIFRNYGVYFALFIGVWLAFGWVLISIKGSWSVLPGGFAAAAGFVLVYKLLFRPEEPQQQTRDAKRVSDLTGVTQEEQQPGGETPLEKPKKRNYISYLDYETAIALHKSYESFPIASLRISQDNKVVQCNKSARKLLGLEREESPFFDDLVYGLGRGVQAWIDGVRKNGGNSKPEMLQVKRGSGDAVVQVFLTPMPNTSDGTLLASLTDATQLKSLEAQFIQSQKMQAIGQLAGGVAHDFNNLLTAISGYCDLLLLRHEKGDPDYGDLIQIHQNANRAAALVGQLLAFSRKQTLQPQILDVNETLSEMSHLLNRLLGEKVRMQSEYGKDLPSVYVDGRQLEQVIMNLVVNARDAMPEGGEVVIRSTMESYDVETIIEKATVGPGNYVVLSVSDSGTGIRGDRLRKIFEPFYSTKEVGEGTGLGLSMVYGIIKQTGGYIFVESAEDQGATFRILLPASDAVQEREQPQQRKQTAPVKTLSGLSVLLVEDEAPVRAFAVRALAMHGVEVTEAPSAEHALELLQDDTLQIDLIVSDVVMPGMDGPTWVRKALADRPETKVIFVSGYAEETFSKEQQEFPQAVFLPKPFSLKTFIDEVRQLCA